MVKPDLRHAKKDDDLWAARYDCRFQHRNASYYDSGLEYVAPETHRALDAGCGSGALAFPLAARARMVVGMDRNLTLIELAQARQAEARLGNLAWVVGDVGHLPFAAGAFDFVGSYNVLHVVPFKAALTELAQSVETGGRLVVRVPYFEPNALPMPLRGLRRFGTVVRRRLVRYSRTFGVRTGVRLAIQDLSPAVVELEKYWLPYQEIEAGAREQLSGCRIERDQNNVTVFWEKKE